MTWQEAFRREARGTEDDTAPDAGYKALMELIDDGFCVIQFIDGPSGPLSDYVHIEANSGYERHTGIDGIVGKTVYDVAPQDGAEWVKIYGEVLRTGEPLRFEREFVEVGRHIEVSATRVEPAAKAQVAVLFRDITERKREERDKAAAALSRLDETLEQRVEEQTAKLMQREEELRQAQKMEAVGQLTGGLAHDFNNLLTAISGSLDFVAKRLEDGRREEILRYLEAAQASTERAASVTQRLLAFSRQQSLMPKPTDVPQLVRSMEDLMRHTIGPHILMRAEDDAEAWPAMVDPNQLESALLNLCINSRDAMPDGGTITISTTNEVIEGESANLPPGDYLRLSVHDTGTGMTAEEISKAFDPYFTTKPSEKGTGLGLSMVYGFARQSGGCATIDSELGKGTTVNIFLPRSVETVARAEADLPVSEVPATGGGHTILVVDDEAIVRFVVVEALEEAGFTVYQAAHAAAGLQVLQDQPEVTLLLTDIGLPGGMTGRELAARAREAREDLRVMFMTGYDEEAATATTLTDTEVLLKPFDFDEMMRRVTSFANRTAA